MEVIVYTIGHSTLELEAFIAILHAHGIQCLADVRSYPGSKKFPHFNRELLSASLPAAGIEYIWLKSLGGRRNKSKTPSPNGALRSAGFRNYADYMLTDEFQSGIDELLETAAKKKTAIMCAEKLFFRCHRRLISDWLVANGVKVIHLFDESRTHEHVLSEMAKVCDKKVIYPAANESQRCLEFQEEQG